MLHWPKGLSTQLYRAVLCSGSQCIDPWPPSPPPPTPATPFPWSPPSRPSTCWVTQDCLTAHPPHPSFHEPWSPSLSPPPPPTPGHPLQASYLLGDSDYLAADGEDGWVVHLLAALDLQLRWLQPRLTAGAWEGLFHSLLDKLLARLEVRGRAFTSQGWWQRGELCVPLRVAKACTNEADPPPSSLSPRALPANHPSTCLPAHPSIDLARQPASPPPSHSLLTHPPAIQLPTHPLSSPPTYPSTHPITHPSTHPPTNHSLLAHPPPAHPSPYTHRSC